MTTATKTAPIDRRDGTRERLLAAARQLFVERGYHATRPQDIARLAGLGQGTFYLYFSDKKACFLAFAAAARVELQEFLQPRLAGIERQEPFFIALIGGMLDYAAENPGLLRTATMDTASIAADAPDLSQQWAADWARGLETAIRRGRTDPKYDPAIVGAILVGAIGGAVTAAGRGAPRDKVIDNAVRFLVHALRPQAT